MKNFFEENSSEDVDLWTPPSGKKQTVEEPKHETTTTTLGKGTNPHGAASLMDHFADEQPEKVERKPRKPDPRLPSTDKIDNAALEAFSPKGKLKGHKGLGWDDLEDEIGERGTAQSKLKEKDRKKTTKNESAMFTTAIDKQKFFVKGGSDKEMATESANYELANMLGMGDAVLPVHVQHTDERDYMMTPFMKGTETLKDKKKPEKDKSMKKLSDEQLSERIGFDFLTSQTDRNPGNVMTKGDKSYSIDNESSLGATTEMGGKSIEATAKSGGMLFGQGIGRLGGAKGNAYMDVLAKRHGLDPKTMKEDELMKVLDTLPIPKDFAQSALDTHGDATDMMQSKGLHPRAYDEGVGQLKHIMDSEEIPHTMGALMGRGSGFKMPKITDDKEMDSLKLAFGNKAAKESVQL